MFATLATGIGERLTAGPLLSKLVPAGVFWGGGILAVKLNGEVPFFGWGLANLLWGEPEWLKDQVDRLFTSLSAFEQFMVIIGILLPSALAVDRFVSPVVRWSEGYWPRQLDFLRKRLVTRNARQLAKDQGSLATLRK